MDEDNFNQQLQIGKIGESYIAEFYKAKGFNVLPVYEKEISEYKGPTLFTPLNENIICPDMFVFNNRQSFWVEAKHKTAFSWHRKTKKWVTGIDIKHYEDYLKLIHISPWPIFLLFLHKTGTAKDTPPDMVSPSGLFGGELDFLSKNENHRHINGGKHGMVYWSHETLKKYSELSKRWISKVDIV